MSFGWSAGDVAQAITLIVKVVKALDSGDGAAQDYREAVAFLICLKRTLDPLQTFSALDAYPAYGLEIRQQVQDIKGPIEDFLLLTTKFEPSLGSTAKTGHQRGISQKLQWRFVTSKKAAELRRKIESHILIIESLFQRITM
jgi:hypothetical protein